MKWYFFSSLLIQTVILIFLGIHFHEFLGIGKNTFKKWTSPVAVSDASTTKNPLIADSNNFQAVSQDSSTQPQNSSFGNSFIASDLLSSEELISTGTGKFNQTPAHQKNTENFIKKFFPGEDKHLKVIDIADKNFINSPLREQLKKIRSLRVYVVVKFNKPISTQTLSNMKRAGFATIVGLPKSSYINKKHGVFYVRFRSIRPASKYGRDVANIYLVKNYTAVGIYQLEIKSLQDKQDLLLQVSVPYTKLGHELIQARNTLLGAKNETLETVSFQNTTQLAVDVKKNESLNLFSEVKYHIDLQKNVSQHIYVQGERINLREYTAEMLQKNPLLQQQFTEFSEKIVPSEYIDSIVAQIDTSRSLAEIWKQIDIILDKDISYDWKKRDLFFSGNLTYYNIKDMYMTAEELGIKKKGACPERTSLEIAILRKMGIAARSATRLYHIYTEVYIPNFGWTTTSLTLNEIPLIESKDKNMAYFVSWSPDHPIQLKWEGQLYPSIVF